MTPERWAQVKALFSEASELSPRVRDAWLARACAGDDGLRDEVLSLLGAAEGADSLPAARAAIAASVRGADARLQPPPRARAGGAAPDAALRTALESALGQQYEIVRLLGHGGMGSVYLARERALERFVAIKVLRPELAEVQQGRERFRREARVAAQLSHPGILPLHTFGEVGGVWYFVMGYVRGVTLAERLRVEGRIPVADAQRILRELAEALECAHKAGVVHRDIKPLNVLIDADTGRTVLADFGIAKVQEGDDSLTATGVVVGTPRYMSPEQSVAGVDVDARSDLWSLGAVGYAMLAGREPGAPTSGGSGVVRHAAAGLPDLRAVAPDVPAELAAVVMRCLAHDPEQRWPSARALRDALALADEEGTGALPGSVHQLSAFGPYAVLWAALWLALAASPFRTAGDRALLALIALVVPAGLVLHVWNVAGGGMPASQLARVAFWPPDWWGMWWPRALRRPTDLWRRLPRLARGVRVVLSLGILALPALVLTREWVEAVTGAGVGWFGLAEVTVLVLVCTVVASAAAWARRQGLGWPEVSRLLFGATATSAGWSAPGLQRLLAPLHGGVRAPDPKVPADYRRAIAEVVAQLPAPARASAAPAADAAGRLVALLARCDEELAGLSAASGARDADRLAAQIAALENAAHGDPETGELARLLHAQLDVVHRMRVRCEMLSARRGHLLHLLHGTWTHLAALRAATPDGERDELARLDLLRRETEAELAVQGQGTAAPASSA